MDIKNIIPATGVISNVILKGERGEPGPTGPVGAIGPTGATGPQGFIGPIGPQGIEGPIGPQGKAFHIDGTYPSYELMLADSSKPDGYICSIAPPYDDDPHSGEGYQWDGFQWVFIFTMQGPPGVPGPQGVQGAQGPQGPQGPTGAQGQKGDRATINKVGEFNHVPNPVGTPNTYTDINIRKAFERDTLKIFSLFPVEMPTVNNTVFINHMGVINRASNYVQAFQLSASANKSINYNISTLNETDFLFGTGTAHNGLQYYIITVYEWY